jgi:lipopolysaccharide transport system permease protein
MAAINIGLPKTIKKTAPEMSISRRIYRYYDLTFCLVEKDLKIRYKSSFLGYLWSLGMPLMQALIFSFVFKIIMRFEIENYTIFLILGLFLWQWINNSIIASPHTYIQNASIIKKVHFERGILSLSVVILELFHFILTLPVILLFIYFSNIELTWNILLVLPVLLLELLFFLTGISLAVSSINLFFRDLERIVAIFLMVAFYLTPVIYAFDFVPAKYQPYFVLNPFMVYVTMWREVVMKGVIEWSNIFWGFGYAVISFRLGLAVYRRLRWRFAEVL